MLVRIQVRLDVCRWCIVVRASSTRKDNEHPIVLQLGGSNAHELATAARLAAERGPELLLQVVLPFELFRLVHSESRTRLDTSACGHVTRACPFRLAHWGMRGVKS
eukprot:2964473-Amphidinium_carterae.1